MATVEIDHDRYHAEEAANEREFQAVERELHTAYYRNRMVTAMDTLTEFIEASEGWEVIEGLEAARDGISKFYGEKI